LPTEAHYEKAAKGPAPRQVPFPWGDDTDTCRFTSAVDCPIHDETAVDAFPEGVSYYGIFQMDGNGFEHVQDFYDERFYTTGPTLDPVQAAGEMWVVRGTHPYSAGSVNYDGIPQRSDWNPIEDSFSFLGVRCARSAW
jgi:formylglycine-generating enzyme required for sulfatase activity